MRSISQTWQVLRLPLWALMLVFCTKAVHAQPASLAGCRAIEDRLARFDCYESLEVDAAETDSAAEAGLPADTGNGAAVERETAETAPEVTPDRSPRSDLATFGMGSADDARLERDAEGREELVDRVAELRLYGHKQWEITLESGQIWRQMLSKTYNLSVGDAVRIAPVERGRYYRLTSPGIASFIQVGRID